MIRRAALGAALARRPLVVKLVADEAYERERRAGRFSGTLHDFQQHRGGLRVRLLRSTRTAALRRARRIVVPSAYLREIALGWGLRPERVVVVPNPAPTTSSVPPRDEARAALGVRGLALGTGGSAHCAEGARRLHSPRSLGSATSSCSSSGTGRSGPRSRQQAVELGVADRVRFQGAGTREDVLRMFRAVDVVLLTSVWENLPHTLLEALAVGTPVIATAVGGIPEIVRDGENGLLVPAHDVDALVAAIERVVRDDGLRAALAAAAAPSVAELSEQRILSRIVEEIEQGSP